MVALTNQSGAIKGVNLFSNNGGSIKNEDSYQPVYNIRGEILRIPIDGLLINIDSITLSQNKLVNTCRTRENIFYIGENRQETMGEISQSSVDGQTMVNTRSKLWNFSQVAGARLDFDSGTFNNGLTIYMTVKHTRNFTSPSYLFYLNNGKHARLGGGTNNLYEFFVSTQAGQVNPSRTYGRTSNNDKLNLFNITLTFNNENIVGLYENGSKINTEDSFPDFIQDLTSIYLFGRIENLAGGFYDLKTLRIWNRAIDQESISHLLKIDRLA